MADILDQSNYSGTITIGFGDTGNGRDYMVQGFCPTANNITAVSFYVNSKDANANIGYAVWIDNADASSHPTGTVAVGIGGFTEITNAQLVTSGLTKYSLASSVTLTPGNKYVMCFAPWNTTTHAWASSYHDWPSSTANPYAPSGFTAAKRSHGDNTFGNWSDPDSGNDDLVFETYYQNTSPTINVSDSSAVTESTTVVITYKENVFDSSTVTDVITQLVKIDIVNVFDSSTVTENLAIAQAYTINTSDSSTVTENFGYALSYNGSTAYTQLKSGAILAGLSSYSISMWINTSTVAPPAGTPLYCERAASGNDILKFQISQSTNGGTGHAVELVLRDDAGTLQFASNPRVSVVDGVTHHIVLVNNAGTIQMYVDNTADGASAAQTPSNTYTNAGLQSRLGADAGDGSVHFNGVMDDVRLFNTALTTANITTIFNGGTVSSGLIDWWKFDEGQGTTTADSAGSNTGTLSGTTIPTWTSSLRTVTTNVQETYLINVFDSSAATESITVLVPILKPSIFDSSTVTDAITNILIIDIINVFDSSTVTDSSTVAIAAGAALSISAFDASAVTESIVTLQIYNINVFDSSAVTDVISQVLQKYNISIFDSSAVTDVVTQVLQIYNINVFDSSAVTENLSIIAPLAGVNVSDSSTVTDNTVILLQDFESLNDVSAVTENIVISALLAGVNVSDSSAVTDVLTGIIKIDIVNVFDSSAVTENLTISAPVAGINVFDSSTVTDSLTIIIPAGSTVSINVFDASTVTDALVWWDETIFTSESVQMVITDNDVIFDQTSISELYLISIVSLVSVSDSSAATDNISVAIAGTNIVFDSSTVTDVISQIIITDNDVIFDSSAVTDIVAQVLITILYLTVFDSSTVTDNVILQLLGILSVSDSSTVTDVITLLVSSFVGVSDSSSITDSVVVAIGEDEVVFDSATATDVLTNIINIFTILPVDISTVTESVVVTLGGFGIVFDSSIVTEFITIFVPGLTLSVFDSSTVTDQAIPEAFYFNNAPFYYGLDTGEISIMLGDNKLPMWNGTSRRPTNPPVGAFGFNYNDGQMEIWDGKKWWTRLFS